jgi:PIN domain nuclease of toxin-antitoxin system
MRLLLDTHIALWTMTGSERLPPKVRALVQHPEAILVVSVISLWEIAIKFARRKGRPNDMPISAAQMAALLAGARCEVLQVAPAHVMALETLPPLHGDPFDRMLVAQARAEPLRLITVDSRLADYGASVEVY